MTVRDCVKILLVLGLMMSNDIASAWEETPDSTSITYIEPFENDMMNSMGFFAGPNGFEFSSTLEMYGHFADSPERKTCLRQSSDLKRDCVLGSATSSFLWKSV